MSKYLKETELVKDPIPQDETMDLSHEFDVKDAQAEALYQRRSYLFLGLSILALTFFVGYGAQQLVLESLTVALLLIMSALAGLWALFLSTEKYRRGMLLAQSIRQAAEIEERASRQATIEAARAALKKTTSSSRASSRSTSAAASGKTIRVHSNARTGRTYRASK